MLLNIFLKLVVYPSSIKQLSYYIVQGRGFRGSSVGKQSACSAGDPISIPGSGRSPGEGIGYPLQYSWASVVAQLVKNPPAMWETWFRSLDLIPGLGRSLGEGNSYPLQYSGLGIPWTVQSMGSQRVGHDSDFHFTSQHRELYSVSCDKP